VGGPNLKATDSEKTIRLIFDKATKDANVTITRIEVRGIIDGDELNNIGCQECPMVR
jgi:hypothetical protein